MGDCKEAYTKLYSTRTWLKQVNIFIPKVQTSLLEDVVESGPVSISNLEVSGNSLVGVLVEVLVVANSHQHLNQNPSI